MSAAITPGLHAGFSYTVTDADTAAALESGLVPVLSTPRVLALVERASVEALEGALEDGATTVGAKVELEHLLAHPGRRPRRGQRHAGAGRGPPPRVRRPGHRRRAGRRQGPRHPGAGRPGALPGRRGRAAVAG